MRNLEAGGEEFMVLLHYAEEPAAKEAAERLRRAAESETIALSASKDLRCTISIGCYVAGPEEANWREAVVEADRALCSQAGRTQSRS